MVVVPVVVVVVVGIVDIGFVVAIVVIFVVVVGAAAVGAVVVALSGPEPRTDNCNSKVGGASPLAAVMKSENKTLWTCGTLLISRSGCTKQRMFSRHVVRETATYNCP